MTYGQFEGHTAGPWGYQSFALSEEIIALNNKLIAVVQSRHCESPDEMHANTKLLAAAPDLLAENRRLRAALDSIKIYGSDTLSGPTTGMHDMHWYRVGVEEMVKRARSALQEEVSDE